MFRRTGTVRRPDGGVLTDFLEPGPASDLRGSDELDDLALLREAMERELREQEFPVHRHLERTAVRRHELQGPDLPLVVLEQFGRQTDGARLVVSDRAVTDLDFQASTPRPRRAAAILRCGTTTAAGYYRRART
jgi:hypothetical protein